ncbi:MAG: cation:proton antiporter, partial [Candidatus Diapherotrites archaeon]|nr:cation:proton antiporter [Candidatus Diapherotrites archaeon]
MPATGFESFLVDFGIVFLFAVLGTLVSLRVRMPPVVGLLVAGFVAGSQGLGLLTNNPAVDVLAELGAVLLLFMVGLEFSLTKIIRFGLRSAIIATGMMGGVFLLVYETGIFMGFGFLGSVVMGAMLCITSTAIFVKVLESNGLLRRPEVPLLVSVLVVEDVLAVMALAFFSALKAGSTVSVGTIVFSIAVSLAVLGATYFLARTVMRRIYPLFKDFQSTDTLIFLAMGLVGVFAFFAAYLRLSPAIGAFLAGSMLSSLPNHKELENAVKPFSLLFAALFFISMGVHINPGAIAAAFLPSGLFILAFLAGGFLVMTTLYFLLAPKNHSSVFAGLSMLSLGEFTLLIAREGAPLVKDFDVVGFSAFAVLVTSIACALFVPNEKAVRARLARSLSARTRVLLYRVSAYTHHLVEAFEPHGVFFSFFGEKLRETSSDVLRVG